MKNERKWTLLWICGSKLYPCHNHPLTEHSWIIETPVRISPSWPYSLSTVAITSYRLGALIVYPVSSVVYEFSMALNMWSKGGSVLKWYSRAGYCHCAIACSVAAVRPPTEELLVGFSYPLQIPSPPGFGFFTPNRPGLSVPLWVSLKFPAARLGAEVVILSSAGSHNICRIRVHLHAAYRINDKLCCGFLRGF